MGLNSQRTRISDEAITDISPINLIDVMVVLVIFLMAVTSFQEEQAVKVNLPDQVDAELLSGPKKIAVVNVKMGGLFLDDKQVSTEQLFQQLSELKNQLGPDVPVSVRGDQEIPYGEVARVVRICKETGFNSVNIVYSVK